MRVLTLAREDLRLTLRDRSSIFWIFIAPFLWVYLFGSMGGTSGSRQVKISLGVLLEDASPASERFVELLKGESFTVTVSRPNEARPSGEGAPSRNLMIPAGFGERIAKREKTVLELSETENANAEGTLAAQVALHKAIVRFLAGEAFGGLEPASDLVKVKSGWATVRKIPSGFYQSLPGNLVMFVLIATMTYGAALLAKERRDGMLRRLAASPLTRGELIAGKLIGRASIAAVQIGVFVLMGLIVFKIEWGTSPVGLVLLLASFVVCASALSLLAGTLFGSPDAASGIGIVLTLVMSALGGCWWPAEIMSKELKMAGHLFPAAWAMDGLNALLSWGGGVADILLPASVLLAYGAGAAFLAARRLRTAV